MHVHPYRQAVRQQVGSLAAHSTGLLGPLLMDKVLDKVRWLVAAAQLSQLGKSGVWVSRSWTAAGASATR